MAYEMVMPYHLHMPSYFLETFTEYPYTCKANDLKEFQKKVVEQKRIEFWGEGIIFWDYKRLELQVVRGYPGTNAPIGYRFNSIEGYCAPWMNIFISLYENVFNKGAVLNPDPSQAIKEWVE